MLNKQAHFFMRGLLENLRANNKWQHNNRSVIFRL